MKLITKTLPQRKKYEKISKTHRKMKNIKNTKILKIWIGGREAGESS